MKGKDRLVSPPSRGGSNNKMCSRAGETVGYIALFFSSACPEINLDEVVSALLHSAQLSSLVDTHHLGHKL